MCPPATTALLAAHWPEARLRMVEAAGHSLSHPGVFAALAEAVRELTSK